MIHPVIKNRVTFDRIDDPAVKSYIIKGHQQVSGQTVTSVLATIENPQTVNPILGVESFIPSESKKYQLTKKNIIKEVTYPISVYINKRKLSSALIFFNATTNILSIDYSDLNSWDSIEVKYYFDGVEYIHSAESGYRYSIELDVDYSLNTVGNHNVLV